MPGKKVTVDFLMSAIFNITSPMWVQDDDIEDVYSKIHTACQNKDREIKVIDLETIWPMDLLEIFSNLSPKGGVILFKGLGKAHQYIETTLMGILKYYEFLYSTGFDPVKIPPNWKLIIVTRTRFYIKDRDVYRKLFKIYSEDNTLTKTTTGGSVW